MKSNFVFIPLIGYASYYLYSKYQFNKAEKKILFRTSLMNIKKLKQIPSLRDVAIRKSFLAFPKNTIKLINRNTHLVLSANNNFFDIQTAINNFFNIKEVSDLATLREEFRFLEKPTSKIVVFSNETQANAISSKFLARDTKIIIIKNEKLKNFLQIFDDEVYVYYPPKFPFSLAKPELYKKDLGEFYNSNPIYLQLKQALFRDIYVIKNNTLFIKDQGVIKIAETNVDNIKLNLSKTGTHLSVYLNDWSSLEEEKQLENFLFENSSLFSSVNILTSKDFALEKKLYLPNQLYENLPQIFITTVKKNNYEKKTYNLSYFGPEKSFSLFRAGELPEVPLENFENYIAPTYVKTIKTENILEKITKDNSFDECIIEVCKEDCPACFILGKMLDHLSLKLKKHKIEKLKLFRINIEKNEMPFIGEFNATPTFLHIVKKEGKIIKVTPLLRSNFFQALKANSNINLEKIVYPNLDFGYFSFMRKDYSKKNYDPDLDLKKVNH